MNFITVPSAHFVKIKLDRIKLLYDYQSLEIYRHIKASVIAEVCKTARYMSHAIFIRGW